MGKLEHVCAEARAPRGLTRGLYVFKNDQGAAVDGGANGRAALLPLVSRQHYGFQILDAAALPVLTCHVTKIDTSFWYQIFGKPNLTGYSSCWEEKKRTVIVDKNSKYNTSLVKSLHEDSVELFVCKDFLRYNMERHEKDGTLLNLTATCEVNCTDLMAQDSDGFPIWGIVGIVLGIIFTGIFIATIFIFRKRLLKQVGYRSVSQNSCSSRTNGLQPSQPLTQSEAEAINDNLQNEQVSISMTS